MHSLLLSVFLALFTQGDTGRVEIIVREPSTGAGLAGVPVTLTLKFPTEPAGPSSTIVTDPRGVALFSGLATGNYVISFAESVRPSRALDFVWIDPGDRKRIEIPVNRLASVSIRLLDPNGRPLRDALVQLPEIGYVDGRRTLFASDGFVHENAPDGVFRIIRVRPGEYYLRIRRPVTPVTTEQESLPMISYFPGVVDFQFAERVVVRGQDIDLGELRLPAQKVFKVTGTIVRRERPRSGAGNPNLYIVLNEGSSAEDPVPLASVQFSAGTNPDELRFETRLPPGTHTIYPMFPGVDELVRTMVTIRDQDVDDVRISAGQSVGIAGRILIDKPSTGILQGLRLTVFTKDRFPPNVTVDRRQAIAPDVRTGDFVVSGLSDGVRYGLRMMGLPPDAYVYDVRLGGLSIFNEGSFVAASGERRLEVEVRTQGSIISGIVRDAFNEPVDTAAVVLAPGSMRRSNSMLYKRTTTDANGRFTLRGVASGEYQIFAWRATPPVGALEDPEVLTPYTGRGAAVRATEGATSETQLRVIDSR